MELLFRALSLFGLPVAWLLVSRWLRREGMGPAGRHLVGLAAGLLLFMLVPGIGIDTGVLDARHARAYAYDSLIHQADRRVMAYYSRDLVDSGVVISDPVFQVRRQRLPLLSSAEVADFRQGSRLEGLTNLVADTHASPQARRQRRHVNGG